MKPIISRLRHTVVALLFALSISAANAQISYTATFDQHLLTTDTVSENATLTFDSDIPTCGHSPQPVRPSCLYTICDFPFLAMLPISRFPLRERPQLRLGIRYRFIRPSRLFPPTGIQASNCSFPPTARYIATTDIGRLFRYKW